MRLGDERGQTGSDFLGVLLLVGMIIAALVGLGVPDTVAAETKRLVCQIAGGGCEAPPQKPPEPPTQPPDGPTQGPAIPNGPLVVLPFPGTVSVTCSGGKRDPAPEKDPKGCKGPDAPGGSSFAVNASATVTADRSPTKLNSKGCAVQTLSLATTLKLEGSGTSKKTEKDPKTGKDKTVASGTLAVFLATQSKYQVTVAPDQADDMASGKRQPPNPLDPRTMRRGEGIQMSEEFYAGHNLQAQYRALQLEMGYEEGRRVSSGVTRLPDDRTVRIYVGDENFVRSALALGIGGKGAKISIGNTKELADGKLRAVDIDISGQEGWNAYQQFVATGKLPQDGAPGTTNPTRATTVKYSDSSKVEAELGRVKIGGLIGDSEGNITETTFPNGVTQTSITGRYNDMGFEYIVDKDANGNRTGTPTYALNAEGVDRQAYGAWRKAQGYSGADLELPPGGNVRLEFTADDLRNIRGQALDQIAWELETKFDVHPRPSREQVAENIERNHGEIKWGRNGALMPVDPIASLIASRQAPEEILAALFHLGMKGKDRWFHDLAAFAHRSALAYGDIRNPDERSRFPGRVFAPSCPS